MEKTPPALSDAETLAREFKEFAYIVSHDLSAPLRAMVEFSRLLKSEQLDALNEDGKLYLSLIIESGEKLQKMMLGLLDFSRLNTMGKPVSNVNCDRILSDCQLVLKDKLTATKAKLEIAPLPTASADAEQLMQLFLIIMDNALKFYAPSKTPHIRISGERNEKECIFIVQDNGIGIEPQFHQRIFQPFQRLHTDSEYPGIGMGLTLAKKIVERHGGVIWVDSSGSSGASFKFTVPHQEHHP